MATAMTSGAGQFNFISLQDNLCQMHEALKEATGQTTFWGKKRIAVNGAVLPMTIGQLRERIAQAAEIRAEDPEFSLEERRAGRALLKKLQTLDAQARADVRCWNLFTRFLAWLREPKPSHRELMPEEYFRAFSKADFEKTFAHEKTPLAKTPVQPEKKAGVLLIATPESMRKAAKRSVQKLSIDE